MELESKKAETVQIANRKILLRIIIAICAVFLLLDLMTPAVFELRNSFFLVLVMNLVVG